MEYNYCPKCGSKSENKSHNLLVCPNCGYNFYINPAPTNAIIIENNKGEILLVKRKYEPKKGFLDLPGGFIEVDESVETSAIREVKEELGVEIKDVKYFSSYPDNYLYQEVNVKTLGITATGKIDSDAVLTPSDDVEEAIFFNKAEIPMDKLAFESIKQGLLDYLKKSDSLQ